MKTHYISLALFFIIFQLQGQVINYQVGDVVDDFYVTDTDGDVWHLSELTDQGKYVYLDFFFVDCVYCWPVQPIFNEFYDTYGCNENDLIMLSINEGRDSDQEVRDYEEEFGGPFLHAPAISGEGSSATIVQSFGVFSYPTVCLIGPGNILLIKDIWPISGIESFEETFTIANINPIVNPCSESLSTADNNQNVHFSLTPNPSQGSNLIITLGNTRNANLMIFDVFGKLAFKSTLAAVSSKIQPNLVSGLYLVKITTEEGLTGIQKLVVH